LKLEEQLLYGELNKIFINQRREDQKKSYKPDTEVIVEKIEGAPEIKEAAPHDRLSGKRSYSDFDQLRI
jgi:hypothetical protein